LGVVAALIGLHDRYPAFPVPQELGIQERSSSVHRPETINQILQLLAFHRGSHGRQWIGQDQLLLADAVVGILAESVKTDR